MNDIASLTANGFPTKLFEEWKKDCKNRFNDIHWAKIWSDHLKAKAYDEGKINNGNIHT